jgi:UDP-glucose:(heptosyl)LPS alpha-1,3-glucosyltransferase
MKVLSFARGVREIIQHERFDIVHSCDRIFSCDIYRAGEGLHREWLEVSSRYMPGWKALLKRMDPLHFFLLQIEARLMQEKSARRVTAISRRGAGEIRRHFGRENVPVIYNGVDPEEFHPPEKNERESARRELGLSDGVFVILFVGSGFFRKGLRYLIEGFSRLTEAGAGKAPLLLVAGRGNTRPYERLARSLGVAEKVRFCGSDIPAPRLYHSADVFVFPTLYEPFGNVCLEALASGLPCVFSSQSGGAEIVKDGVSGLVLNEPTDTDEIARLVRICMEKERADAMGRAARALALEYSVTANADHTEAIYREIAAEKNRDLGETAAAAGQG